MSILTQTSQSRHSFRRDTDTQINSCLLSGSYQVHLYVKYKYLHYKYIQGQTWAVAKARIALCCPDSVSLCPFKCAQPFTKKSLCLMCLTVNGNMCFSLSKKAETNQPEGREEDLWRKKKSGCRRKTCHIVWSFSCGASFQGRHLTKQTLSLRWADTGFVETRLGGDRQFAVHVV